jgi:hypothetical protein
MDGKGLAMKRSYQKPVIVKALVKLQAATALSKVTVPTTT